MAHLHIAIFFTQTSKNTNVVKKKILYDILYTVRRLIKKPIISWYISSWVIQHLPQTFLHPAPLFDSRGSRWGGSDVPSSQCTTDRRNHHWAPTSPLPAQAQRSLQNNSMSKSLNQETIQNNPMLNSLNQGKTQSNNNLAQPRYYSK